MINQSHYFSLSLNLQAVNNNATTYMIAASFGDSSVQPLTATAWAKTLDGQQYPACTTTQYGYKPACNMTTLTISTQSTEVMTTTMSPEEMQQAAEGSGQLRPELRFSLGFPWFSLHYVAAYSGQDVLDVGLSPLGCDVVMTATIFNSWIGDFLNAILKAYVLGWVLAESAVLAATYMGPEGFVLAFLLSIFTKSTLLLSAWNSVESMKSSLVGAFAALIIGTIGTMKMLANGIVSIVGGLIEAATKFDFWKFIYRFIYIPINMVFIIYIVNRLARLGGI